MHKYLTTIVMPDGSIGKSWGLFSSTWAAVDQAMSNFPAALRISARKIA